MAVERIGVIGAGAWGTALANVAATRGEETIVWAREPEVVESVNRDHTNAVFLPDVALDGALRATGDLAEACANDALLFVVPTQFVRAVATEATAHIGKDTPVVLCAKGIERETNALLSQVLAETVPHARPAVLSGPTFADEVAKGLPAAVTLACAARDTGEALAARLGSPTFRPYLSGDIVGAQIGGAVKNVLAIAAGIVAGRELGENAKAAIVTRGMAELLRFGQALGSEALTLMGLSGLGDLVLTCGSPKSRNHSLGRALAAGEAAGTYLGSRKSVAEGAYTAKAIVAVAAQQGIDLPICASVDAVLNRDVPVDDAIEALLNRPFRDEMA